MRTVAALAGFDSSGGAGVSVDEKTIYALGCHPYLIKAAVTQQNERAVLSINPTTIAVLTVQLRQLDREYIAAIKIGMMVNAQIVKVVADYLDSTHTPIIIDPVLASSSGDSLLAAEALPFFKNTLLKKRCL